MAKIILVTGGKGGTGKSTVSVFLGRALSNLNKKVLLIELDNGLRGMDIMLGATENVMYDFSDILNARCKPIDGIIDIPTKRGILHFIAASNDRNFIPTRIDFEQVLKYFSAVYDYIILDTAAGIDEKFNLYCKTADLALIVTVPDPVTIRDSEKTALHINCESRLVINKFNTTYFTKEIPDIDAIIDKCKVQLISVVPVDQLILKAISEGKELPINSPAKGEFDDLARRVDGERVFLNVKRLS